MHKQVGTDLMSSSLRTKAKVSDVHSLSQATLRGHIKNGIQRNVLQNLVYSELMGGNGRHADSSDGVLYAYCIVHTRKFRMQRRTAVEGRRWRNTSEEINLVII